MLSPHVDAEWLTRCFGEQHNLDLFELLDQIARVGAPVDVGKRGNFERELAYGNHSSANRHANEVWEKEVGDVKLGREIVAPTRSARMVRGLGLDEKGKMRTIHDATFSGEPKDGRGGGRPVTETMYWDQIPEFRLADVMLQIVRGIPGLREEISRGTRILIHKTDVKSAFRQAGVDPAGAVKLGYYVLRDYRFVDLRVRFG